MPRKREARSSKERASAAIAHPSRRGKFRAFSTVARAIGLSHPAFAKGSDRDRIRHPKRSLSEDSCGQKLSIRPLVAMCGMIHHFNADGSQDDLNVICIDDFAFRRGQTYGTTVCDMERRRAVTLLPDRAWDTSRSWLARHQSISIAAGDQSGVAKAGCLPPIHCQERSPPQDASVRRAPPRPGRRRRRNYLSRPGFNARSGSSVLQPMLRRIGPRQRIFR